MSGMNRVLCGALLTCTLMAGPMVRADDAKPVTLVVKPKVGRVVRMKMTININFMGMDMTMDGVEKETVKEVLPNGDVVLEIADEGGTMTVGGAKQDLPSQAPYMKTVDRLGKTKKTHPYVDDGFTTEQINNLMDAITDVVLTDKPVNTNDTWEHAVENPAVKDKPVTIKNTYLGLDKIGGKDYWKVKQTVEAVVNAEGGLLNYDFTEWVDPATGDTVKADGTVKGLPSKFGIVAMHLGAAAVKAGATDKAVPGKAGAKP